MRVVDSYQIVPGSCGMCGGTHVPAIDTERDFDHGNANYGGRIYICHVCVQEMGRSVGMTSLDELTEIRGDYNAVIDTQAAALADAEQRAASFEAKYDDKCRVMTDLFDIAPARKPRAATKKASAA